jgi:hypothetical protein
MSDQASLNMVSTGTDVWPTQFHHRLNISLVAMCLIAASLSSIITPSSKQLSIVFYGVEGILQS